VAAADTRRAGDRRGLLREVLAFPAEDVARMLGTTAVAGLGSPGEWRMVPTAANGQPAAAAYQRGADGTYRAFGIVVLTAATTGIARIVVFGDPGLFGRFGLPPTWS
jgi:hypothetical protein